MHSTNSVILSNLAHPSGITVLDLQRTTDLLSSYFIAEQSNPTKKERDYAVNEIDFVKKNLRSEVTSSLSVQVRGINRDLMSRLI